MKKIILTLSLLFLAGLIFSQDSQVPSDTVKNWKIGGQVGLAFTQVSLTNWAAGGENALSASGLLRLGAEYKKNQTSWDNYLLAGYGILKQGDREVQKNDDRLEILSKYGRKAGKSWYYSAQFNFRSQFAPGYKDPVERTEKISDWLSPGYITFSLGMDYKPNDNFSLFLSPVTSKITLVVEDSLSNAGAYGVTAGETLRSEFGGFVKMIYKKENIVKNVNFSTTLDLFSNYAENPEKVDVNWEMFIAMNVNELLTVTLNTQLLYDYDVKFVEIENGSPVEKDKVQFKEVLGVGLTYKF